MYIICVRLTGAAPHSPRPARAFSPAQGARVQVPAECYAGGARAWQRRLPPPRGGAWSNAAAPPPTPAAAPRRQPTTRARLILDFYCSTHTPEGPQTSASSGSVAVRYRFGPCQTDAISAARSKSQDSTCNLRHQMKSDESDACADRRRSAAGRSPGRSPLTPIHGLQPRACAASAVLRRSPRMTAQITGLLTCAVARLRVTDDSPWPASSSAL